MRRRRRPTRRPGPIPGSPLGPPATRRRRRPPAAARRRRAVLLLVLLLALGAGLAWRLAGGGDDGGGAPRSQQHGPGAAAVSPTAGERAAAGADADGAGPAAGDDAAPAPPPTAAQRAQAAVARMSLGRQVGELIVISFAGTTPPPYVLDALRGGRAAGVILFGGNVADPAGVRALARRVQRAAGGDAIVCLDQEGGDIRILRFAPPEVGQARQPTPAAARASAAATARALRGVGVNVTLGPVADVAATTPGSVMAGRAFPGDARAVGASVAAAVAAYRRAGVAPTLKHFPGLGGATRNTDFASATIDRTRAQLVADDLAPYRAALETGHDGGAPAPAGDAAGAGGGRGAGADAAPAAGPPAIVMLNHARYPAIDPDRIASQSRAIVTGLLRDELGFDGVAMTDSLEARAVDDATPGDADVGLAAVRSVAAGADLMLLTGPGSFPLVRDALIARARSDPAFRARIEQSAARVVALRERLAGPAARS